jgi:uncharacterized protein
MPFVEIAPRSALKRCDMSGDAEKKSALHFSGNHLRVLVTGATGFIGRLLVEALLIDGHEVLVLTRRIKAAEKIFSGKVKCISRMEDLPADVVVNLVVNLAGARVLGWRWSEARKKTLHASRITLTQSVVQWIARAEQKPQLLLSASAIGYYGVQAQDDATALRESSPPQPIFMSQLCQQWEAEAMRACEVGVAVSVMRFGVVLGHQGALPMMLLPIKLGMGGKLGTGKQWLSWIHVQDVLRGIAHLCRQHFQSSTNQVELIRNGAAGMRPARVYNFTAPEVVSQHEFSQQAARVLHRPCVIPTPAFAMRLLLGEQADLLLEGQKVVPDNLVQSGFTFQFSTLESALVDLCH